jgi:hypothetical protein
VTTGRARPPDAATWAERYETLRSHMVQAATTQSHEGLIVLLRQGVAAWMMMSAESKTPRAGVSDLLPRAKARRFPEESNASFVQALATMALAGRYAEIHA